MANHESNGYSLYEHQHASNIRSSDGVCYLSSKNYLLKYKKTNCYIDFKRIDSLGTISYYQGVLRRQVEKKEGLIIIITKKTKQITTKNRKNNQMQIKKSDIIF